MNKNIFYIEQYKNDIKEKNIGFLKINFDSMYVFLNIKTTNEPINEIRIITTSGENILLNGNNVNMKQNTSNQMVLECNIPIEQDMINEVIIPLEGEKQARSFVNSEVSKKDRQISKSAYKDENIIPNYENDKWSQLCKTYQEIHIYPEADIVIINPKDIVVLTRRYHDLATNSFVLHAYYNYKQLLLLRYKKHKECLYYLGAPGIYNEREKRIAMMFGFESFENGENRLQEEEERKVYEGCFGYYMKKVDI